ncbi:hypothetical protein MMC25_001899 [Agyrium rufum]|nr:hypothetical protein [Agyrium rufum]
MPKKDSADTALQPRGAAANDDDVLPAREKLPSDLQKLVDDEEKLVDQIYEESNLRYAAYATRLRTILLSAHRYVAYTSDIGESFRPVAHPYLIRSAYGISWAYLIGDVGHEGYKAYLRNQRQIYPHAPGTMAETATNATTTTNVSENLTTNGTSTVGTMVQAPRGHVPAIDDYRAVMAERAIFQGLASMGLPAFTIHSIVRYSGRALKNAKNTRIRTYGPIGLGLAAVPFLPFLFDKPVESAVEWTFHKAFETIGGPDAVGHTPSTGRDQITKSPSPDSKKEL